MDEKTKKHYVTLKKAYAICGGFLIENGFNIKDVNILTKPLINALMKIQDGLEPSEVLFLEMELLKNVVESKFDVDVYICQGKSDVTRN